MQRAATVVQQALTEIGGVDVPVVDLPDLLKSKRAGGRDADVRDVDRLTRGHRAAKPDG
jgi:outer membrane biogenesis lipoprotein LolB